MAIDGGGSNHDDCHCWPSAKKKQKPEINNDDDDVRPDVFKPWWILHSSFVMSEEKKGLKYEIIFGYDDHHFHFSLVHISSIEFNE